MFEGFRIIFQQKIPFKSGRKGLERKWSSLNYYVRVLEALVWCKNEVYQQFHVKKRRAKTYKMAYRDVPLFLIRETWQCQRKEVFVQIFCRSPFVKSRSRAFRKTGVIQELSYLHKRIVLSLGSFKNTTAAVSSCRIQYASQSWRQVSIRLFISYCTVHFIVQSIFWWLLFLCCRLYFLYKCEFAVFICF